MDSHLPPKKSCGSAVAAGVGFVLCSPYGSAIIPGGLTTTLHFTGTGNLAQLVSEYMFIYCSFGLLRNFFNQKYSAILKPRPLFRLQIVLNLVRICVKITWLIGE